MKWGAFLSLASSFDSRSGFWSCEWLQLVLFEMLPPFSFRDACSFRRAICLCSVQSKCNFVDKWIYFSFCLSVLIFKIGCENVFFFYKYSNHKMIDLFFTSILTIFSLFYFPFLSYKFQIILIVLNGFILFYFKYFF